MAYDNLEASVDQGHAFYLYYFNDGINEARFTSADHPIIIPTDPISGLTEVYLKSPLSVGPIEVSGQIEHQDVEIVFPIDDVFAQNYLAVAAEITTLNMYRGHYQDVDDIVVHWKGRIIGVEATNDEIKITAESIFTSQRRIGNRAVCQRTCRWVLYQPGCYLDINDWTIPGTITNINGLVLIVNEAGAQPEDDFDGGIVIWNGRMGHVEQHVDTALRLVTMIPGLSEAFDADGPQAVSLAPGCKRNRLRCEGRFGNGINFGGYDRMPKINPFSTSIT